MRDDGNRHRRSVALFTILFKMNAMSGETPQPNYPLDEPSKAIRRIAEVAALIVRPASTFFQAKADAFKTKNVAKAEVEATELKMRAQMNAELEMIRHQENKEAILAKTQSLLKQQEQAGALPDKFGETPVEPDWLFNWAKIAQDVSDDEVQWWFARVLAGEIEQPGRLSLKLLHKLSILGKSDAQTFVLFANYVWEDSRHNFIKFTTMRWNHSCERCADWIIVRTRHCRVWVYSTQARLWESHFLLAKHYQFITEARHIVFIRILPKNECPSEC